MQTSIWGLLEWFGLRTPMDFISLFGSCCTIMGFIILLNAFLRWRRDLEETMWRLDYHILSFNIGELMEKAETLEARERKKAMRQIIIKATNFELIEAADRLRPLIVIINRLFDRKLKKHKELHDLALEYISFFWTHDEVFRNPDFNEDHLFKHYRQKYEIFQEFLRKKLHDDGNRKKLCRLIPIDKINLPRRPKIRLWSGSVFPLVRDSVIVLLTNELVRRID